MNYCYYIFTPKGVNYFLQYLLLIFFRGQAPEAVANLVWSIFLWWSQINDIQKMLALQNKLQSNRIDMKGVIQEYQETQRTAEVSEKKQAFLQDFKEMITEAIKALKSDTEWAELGDYYLALTFLFDMVDTELSSEFNITIGNQMLVAYPSKLGHILDDTPPLLDYSAGSGEFIKYKGRSYCWVEISQEGQILLTKKMMDFLKVRPGMELLSIRSSDIAFTMGAKGPLLEKAENYDGEIPLF